MRNCCLGSFLATRHPPQSGKVPPSLQEGREGVLRPPDFVVDPREPLQRSQASLQEGVSAVQYRPREKFSKQGKKGSIFEAMTVLAKP